MRKFAVAFLLAFACAATTSATEIAFVDTYDQALEVAGEKNQNILITFYADW